MSLDLQFQIKNNPNFQRYLREHSEWYKILTRSPQAIKEFEEKVKEEYKLRPVDRINRVLESIEMVQSIMSSFR